MAEIRVDKSKCTGCRICEKACPFNCIQFFDDYPIISRECRLCRVCISACNNKALNLVGGEGQAVDSSQYNGIMVFAEQRRGEVVEVAYELLGKAQEMAKILDEPVTAALLGEGVKDCAKDLISYGADKVYVFDDQRLREFRDDPYVECLCKLIDEQKPSILLIGATAVGRNLAPRISMRKRTGLTADCTSLEIDPETKLLVQTRPAFGGNVMAAITCEKMRPQMATVRGKVMEKMDKDPKRRGEVVHVKTPAKLKDRVKLVQRRGEEETQDIGQSQVIVVGGRGMERREGFTLLKELADAIGASVGATRPPVEEGWISHHQQIGLSGKTVKPKLYISFGVSGTVQHTAGMESSDYIIAVNKDPDAPIFKIADLGVVADTYSILADLIEQLKTK